MLSSVVKSWPRAPEQAWMAIQQEPSILMQTGFLAEATHRACSLSSWTSGTPQLGLLEGSFPTGGRNVAGVAWGLQGPRGFSLVHNLPRGSGDGTYS